jgi:hypothetical protein
MNKTKILIIRSAARVFNPCINALKKEFPDSIISVLAPESMRESLSKDPLIDEVIGVSGDGRISLFSCGMKTVRRLQNEKFNIAVSLYNVDQGLGYSNIDLLALATKSKNLRSFNSKEKFQEFSAKNVYQKILREKLSSFWVVLNSVLTLVLFFAIIAGITIEWLVRKIIRRRVEKIPDLQPVKLSNQQ